MSEKSKENLIQEAQRSQEISNPNRQGLEVATSAGPDSLQEKLGVLGDAIGHDVPITSANLTDLSSAFEEMKLSIGGKEITLKDAESLAAISNFLKETNTSWGVKEEDLPTFKFEFTDPKELEYKKKSENTDKSKFGQYTLNPEAFGIDFEKAKIFIPDLSSMVGKKLPEVFKYVVDTYGDKYYIPGIEYWKWLIENPDKAEETAKKQGHDIKERNYYYFPGSSMCDVVGTWRVPYCIWDGRKFIRNYAWLEREWSPFGRFVLLERE